MCGSYHKKKDYELVIFDLDGTIVDTSCDIILCAKFILEKYHCSLCDDNFIRQSIGGGVRALLLRCAPELDGIKLNAACDFFKEFYLDNCSRNSVLYPHAFELLSSLREHGIKSAIATMKGRSATLKILQDLGIVDFFLEIVTADDIEKTKPDPECIIKILDNLGCTNEKTLIVGDTSKDIFAGKNAQIDTCGVLFGYGVKSTILEAEPDYIINQLHVLEQIIF